MLLNPQLDTKLLRVAHKTRLYFFIGMSSSRRSWRNPIRVKIWPWGRSKVNSGIWIP